MDYGKFAYFKTEDIEKRMNKIENKSLFFGCFEHSNPSANEYFENKTVLKMPLFWASVGSRILLNFRLTLNHTIEQTAMVRFVFNGYIIHQKTYNFPMGNTEISTLKAVSCFADSGQTFEIEIEGNANYTATVKSFDFVVYGNQVESFDSSGNMNVGVANFCDGAVKKLAAVYVENEKIFIAEFQSENLLKLTKEDFTFFRAGKLAAIAYDKSGHLFVFRTNSNNQLFFASAANPSNETFVSEKVSALSSGTSAKEDETDLLVCYIKEGEVKYRTIKNGNLEEEKELTFLKKTYVDINVAAGFEDRNFVVVTEKSGANFCTYSLLEGKIPNDIHSLNLMYQITINEII